MYEVHIERRAVKELKKIASAEQTIITRKIFTILSAQPYPTGGNPKRLKGAYAFRLRIGDYRVVYTIEKDKVFVYAIRNRRDAYC